MNRNGSEPKLQPSLKSAEFFRLGDVYAQQGKYEEVAHFILLGLQLNPTAFGKFNNLGNALHKMERTVDAIACYERALSIQPDYATALNNLGIALASLARHDEALERYEEALAIQPVYPEALNNLGVTLHALGRDEEAAARFECALSTRPLYLEATINLAHTLKALLRFEEAAKQYKIALLVKPSDAALHLLLANCLAGAHQNDEAISRYQMAIDIQPEYADAHAGLAFAQQEAGQIEDARKSFECAILINPRHPSYFRGWAFNSAVVSEDPIFKKMRELAASSETLDNVEKVELHFAMGKALADTNQLSEAFEQVMAGSALRRQQVEYNEKETLNSFDQISEVFSAEFMLRRRKYYSLSSSLPIFVVGMPRSGSTLVEQVLASHPNVVAGGELNALEEAIKRVVAGSAQTFPYAAVDWESDQFRKIGEQYLESLNKCVSEKDGKISVFHITDKKLDNVKLVGLINIIFPQAKIIHTYRDPVDTCLSCFSIMFQTAEFSYDLGELGRRYRAYKQLIRHWHKVLPLNTILDLRYEDVVKNTEFEVRRLLAYCELDWDPACLNFYETRRPVRTASVVQVRQPIYETSIGKWRPDESVLRPLLDGLG